MAVLSVNTDDYFASMMYFMEFIKERNFVESSMKKHVDEIINNHYLNNG